MTRILHTADWHLGARLVDCDRHAEHAAFLEWLLARIEALRPDLLVVAGDIFDTATPPQEALALYYGFLARLARDTRCRALILGGNHDSPATLHAPREILAALNIQVIATLPEDPAQSLFEFPDVVVCAVPFLRERDVRQASPGQTADEIAAAIRNGIRARYADLRTAALLRANGRPLLSTGHLTAVGCSVSPSERPIHIGNLGAVEASCFEGFSYTALGHIHKPQSIGGDPRIRYSGSPIPLSFSEVDTTKEVRVIDVADGDLQHHAVSIPVFRPLLRLSCDAGGVGATLAAHQAADERSALPWIELTVEDGRSHPDLDRQVREAAARLRLRVLKLLIPVPPASATDDGALSSGRAPVLAELKPEQVFEERLRRAGIEPASQEGSALTLTFSELLDGMQPAAVEAQSRTT